MKKYPLNWKSEIRPAILERAKHRCEKCGVKNYDFGYRDLQGHFYSWEYICKELDDHGNDLFDDVLSHCYDKKGNPIKGIKIVLTICHLDHDIKNNEYSNLAALCQRCHNIWDIPFRLKNRKDTLNKKKKIQLLFK